MADKERRDSHEDHAWAELTWRKLFSFVVKFGFIPGFICGMVALGIFAWTNWYQVFAVQVWTATKIAWYVPLSVFLAGVGYFYINHRLDKRKKR